jgi:hypothetical protein
MVEVSNKQLIYQLGFFPNFIYKLQFQEKK